MKNTLRPLLPPFLRALILLVAALAGADALAQAQTDMTTQTAWRWRGNVPVSTLEDDLDDGYRIVDIEVESTSPFRVSATLVLNSGAYQKSWWWYYGQTATQVSLLYAANGARLIDVEPYETAAGLRYAVVMIQNTGDDRATTHGWRIDETFSEVVDFRNSNPGRRIIDIQPYRDGGALRYAYCWVSNSGNTFESNSGLLLNSTLSTIQTHLNTTGYRLIDLEIEDGTGRASAITVPSDGDGWFWFTGVTIGDVGLYASQYASRIIDIQRYETSTGAFRYAIVVRPNDNDLTVLAMGRQRSRLPITAESGFLLREFNGATSTLSGLRENANFAPASTLKTAYHFVAMRRVALGLDDLDNSVVVATGLNGSCPNGTAPTTRSLRETLRRMMENSSNTDTEAVRNRYGDVAIEANCAAFGAPGVDINGTMGCACTQNLNEATLMDLAGLHESVIAGALGSERDEFYSLMSNGTNFGRGAFRTDDVLDEELEASSLNDTERTLFRMRMRLAHKGGSYTCNSATLGPVRRRSRAAYVSLPFRSGCGTENREYFIGAWVDWGVDSADSDDAVGVAITTLFRNRLQAAIASWENADCTPFEVHCNSRVNSTGSVADCEVTGSPYLVDNAITVWGRDLPQNQFAMLIWANRPGFVPFAGGSKGNLCLGGTLVRFTGSIQNSGGGGTVGLSPSLWSLPTNTGLATSAEAGVPIYLQWWFRDRDGSGNPTSNYTNGLRATFI
ncbi:MAG: serine hydrolase [Planctomycetota bacterium]